MNALCGGLENRPFREMNIESEGHNEGMLLLTPEENKLLRILFIGLNKTQNEVEIFETCLDESNIRDIERHSEINIDDKEYFSQLLAASFKANPKLDISGNLICDLRIPDVDNVNVRIQLKKQSTSSLSTLIFLDLRTHLLPEKLDNDHNTTKKRSFVESVIPLNSLPKALHARRRKRLPLV
uniref:Uncharacterized protein n=1 Tax=Aureoumbra lagunensis TaxID=44058 RepID=A0A7S3NKZ5_9STRA|mmetsp:Transcript_21040/g.27279  ORF Transcript_21040/g.27279 Transcript_21040/m.27279 type:complete len:182 (+) Transcript_21040:77-622(+)